MLVWARGHRDLPPTAPTHTQALQPLLTLALAADIVLVWQIPVTAHHFLSPVSHSFFSLPHLGTTKASLVGTSVCDSATGEVWGTLQQDQHP